MLSKTERLELIRSFSAMDESADRVSLWWNGMSKLDRADILKELGIDKLSYPELSTNRLVKFNSLPRSIRDEIGMFYSKNIQKDEAVERGIIAKSGPDYVKGQFVKLKQLASFLAGNRLDSGAIISGMGSIIDCLKFIAFEMSKGDHRIKGLYDILDDAGRKIMIFSVDKGE